MIRQTPKPYIRKLIAKHTKPPADQRGWIPLTSDLIESPAWRSLSINARRIFDRIVIEHLSHGRQENGGLMVTHVQFIQYGANGDKIADAIDELAYKGLIRVQRGRAADGTPHPNIFRLTMTGDREGAAASNEWKGVTEDRAKQWKAVRADKKRSRAKKVGSLKVAAERKIPRSANTESSRSVNTESVAQMRLKA